MNNQIFTNSTRPAITFGVICALALTGRVNAQSTEFVPFSAFMEETKAASFGERVTRPGNQVREAGAFEEMRQHVLAMYQGVDVTHSFVQDSSHFDCVPVGQQPSVRGLGLDHLAAPPPQPMLAKTSRPGASALTSSQPTDEFGNSTTCEENTIPVRRLNLDTLTKFPTLRAFFSKIPSGQGAPTSPDRNAAPTADPNAGHRYSFTYQTVNNLGGSSHLNVWSPYVNQADGLKNFSLSQQWYVGGSGSSLQTAEVGWQNIPYKTNSQYPRLFIYWTANHYNGTGCYNLECPGFVQRDNRVVLGGLLNVSTLGGDQVEFEAGYLLYEGNWWLSIDGIWVGYYPGSIYQGGQMSKYAQQIQFGSESYSTTTQFPPEGSGNWSNLLYQNAAYQSNVFYYNTLASPVSADLTRDQPSEGCYTITGPFSDSNGGIYFYEGGPGGVGCN